MLFPLFKLPFAYDSPPELCFGDIFGSIICSEKSYQNQNVILFLKSGRVHINKFKSQVKLHFPELFKMKTPAFVKATPN